METAATLIEGIFASTYGLTLSSYSLSATQAASGSMTYGSVTTVYSKYIQVGKLAIWIFQCHGTTGGTASYGLQIALPVTAASSSCLGGGGWCSDGGSSLTASIVPFSTTKLEVRRVDSSNFGLGATRYASGVVVYEAA